MNLQKIKKKSYILYIIKPNEINLKKKYQTSAFLLCFIRKKNMINHKDPEAMILSKFRKFHHHTLCLNFWQSEWEPICKSSCSALREIFVLKWFAKGFYRFVKQFKYEFSSHFSRR